jgi:tripartite-type tricarboxylate transporter receptor subunit TctC
MASTAVTASNTQIANTTPLLDCQRQRRGVAIAPVASIAHVPLVMEVHPSFPATTVPEFIAYAKANLGKVNMASAGLGSGNHLCGELFKIAGVDMIHVPYRGEGPALADVLGGQVEISLWHSDPSLPSSRRANVLAVLTLVQCASQNVRPIRRWKAGRVRESRAATQTL